MVAIFSFSEAAEGTSPRSSGMMASDYRFTPNVSIVEGSYGRPRRMGRYRFHRHRWLICWKEAGPIITSSSPGGLMMHVNKVHSVKTIDCVARELGESVDWLHDVADEMDTEDGVIWVYGDSDNGVMAFTNFGIETLTDLIEMHKQDPTILQRRNDQA